jgi:hypothetical protein
MGGDPIPTPFILMVNQVSETKFNYKFKAREHCVDAGTKVERTSASPEG